MVVVVVVVVIFLLIQRSWLLYFNQVVLVIIQELGNSHVINKTVLGTLSIVVQLFDLD
jgi:hypothetical protein